MNKSLFSGFLIGLFIAFCVGILPVKQIRNERDAYKSDVETLREQLIKQINDNLIIADSLNKYRREKLPDEIKNRNDHFRDPRRVDSILRANGVIVPRKRFD